MSLEFHENLMEGSDPRCDEDLVESRYNYRFTSDNGDTLICNGLSGTMIADPGVELHSRDLRQKDREFLRTHSFIVAPDVDETALLIDRNEVENDRHDRVELTLMLHEDCNFRCTYCYQDFENKKFRREGIDALLAYLEDRMPAGGALSIHFFGGEPLLNWPALSELVEAVGALATRVHFDFRHSVTTNGSLLHPDRVRFLADHGTTHLKITLDGPPEIHDSRRMLRNQKPTFEGVVANIAYAAQSIDIILRVNIDSGNVDHIETLFDILQDRVGVHRGRLHFDFNLVVEKASASSDPRVRYAMLLKLEREAMNRGFGVKLPSLIRHRYCGFNSRGTMLFDTGGSAYLCSRSEKFRVGNLTLPDEIESAAGETTDGMVAAFRKTKDVCRECNLLPICGGGCTYLYQRSGKPPCPGWASHLSEYLAMHAAAMEQRQRRAVDAPV